MRLYFPTLRAAQVDSSLTLKKLGMFAFFISLSNNTLATTNFSPESCNTGFMGVVKKIADSSAPFSSLPQETISFDVSKAFKGQPSREYSVTLIKGGTYNFKVGDTYKIYAQDGLICSLEKDKEIKEARHDHHSDEV